MPHICNFNAKNDFSFLFISSYDWLETGMLNSQTWHRI
jgi:hypothetical protein